MSTEIVRCFNETVRNDPSISEAIAAIQTLLEVIKCSNGELFSSICKLLGFLLMLMFSCVTLFFMTISLLKYFAISQHN